MPQKRQYSSLYCLIWPVPGLVLCANATRWVLIQICHVREVDSGGMEMPGGEEGSSLGAEGNNVPRFECCEDMAPSAWPHVVLQGITGLQGQAVWGRVGPAVGLKGISCPLQPACPTVLRWRRHSREVPVETGACSAELQTRLACPACWHWLSLILHVAGAGHCPTVSVSREEQL